MSCRPQKPPVPCECGCGVLLAQRQRSGGRSQRTVWDAACEERLAAKREAERKEQRDILNIKRRERYRQKLACMGVAE